MSKILEALAKLEQANDAQWTADGQPKIDAIRWLAQDQTITREQVVKEAPNFSRTNTALEPAQAAPVDPADKVQANAPVIAVTPRTADSTASPVMPDYATRGEATEKAMDDFVANSTLTELEESIQRGQQALQDLRGHISNLREEEGEIVRALDHLIARRDDIQTAQPAPHPIRQYLDAQRKLVEERIDRDRKIAAHMAKLEL